jgi:MSHA biogenesis protein MshJ
MKKWWETQAARINALSVRERIFLFLAVIACFVAVVDSVLLSPAKMAHKQLTQRFEKQNADLQSARDEMKLVATPVDSGATVSAETDAVKLRLDTVNQEINEALPTAAQTTPLAQVLVHLLRRHDGLTLVRTSAVAPVVDAAAAAAKPASLTRQGVELTVSGPYAELVRYVKTLETAMPQIRWGSMTLLKSDKGPTVLTLQLFVVGLPS